jgi:hypothetical protein
LIFFLSCSKTGKTEENNISIKEQNKTKTVKKPVKKENFTTVKVDGFTLKFDKNGIVYPKEKTVLLFENNNTYSKAQESVLQKLKMKYYKTDSGFLKKYFNITSYPTIVILDKNKTVKYENFTPYEILKAEGF